MPFSHPLATQSPVDLQDEHPLTEQHHKEACDIHNIMARYDATGLLEHVNQHQGTYGDFTSAPDLLEAHRAIQETQEMFDSLPSKMRREFGDDPVNYIEFMQNPSNYDQIVDMGLDASHLPTPAPEPKTKATPAATPETPSDGDS